MEIKKNATLGNIPIYLDDDQIKKVKFIQNCIKQNPRLPNWLNSEIQKKKKLKEWQKIHDILTKKQITSTNTQTKLDL
ncbi:MAG: hypothetical protein [Microvirus sp.]|nr:MAG: hypothetical protein [Microvirus sp.]